MQWIVTPKRMQALEKAHMERSGETGLLLMERAARAITDELLSMTPGGALFLCGPGNNGGDGFAAARMFAEAGRVVEIWFFGHDEMIRGAARENMLRCAGLKLPMHRMYKLPDSPPKGMTVVVDALFGTGFSRPLEDIHAQAVEWINRCGLPVLAVDMPTGDADLMIRADVTVTFHRMKTPHLLFPGRANSGRIVVAEIGIGQPDSDADYSVLEDSDIQRLLPPRKRDAHKGDCGHALLLAGSIGMVGAAGLCANAALRGGAGLVTVACPSKCLPLVQLLAPCAMCVTQDRLEGALVGKDAIAAGPGLGASPEVDQTLSRLLTAKLPQVWDADALNWLSRHKTTLSDRFVITPHPGEAARLLACPVKEITDDPIAAAERLYEAFGATVLLKGATTVIVGQGRHALNVTGTPGMATGGSGDVLTGLIAAFLAQGLDPFDAAQLAAHVHGRAGEVAARARGVRSMIATDLLDALRIE